jgi:hypothetical protein
MAKKKKPAGGGPGPGDETAELLNQLICRHLLRRVAEEGSEPEAMRKALFTLIMATQDGAGAAGAEVIQWLLTTFPPLAGPTHDRTYDIGGGAFVGRALDSKGGKQVLVISKEFVESLIGVGDCQADGED